MNKIRCFGMALLLGSTASLAAGSGNRVCKAGSDRPFPIVAWMGPGSDILSDSTVSDMAKAGFSLWYLQNIRDPESIQKALELGGRHGIGVFVVDDRIHHKKGTTGLPLESDIEAAVRQWMSYPALAGYGIRDEPAAHEFSELTRIKNIVAGIDPARRAYVNLFPTYANSDQVGAETYADYVEGFMRSFDPSVLSYDHYCIRDGEVVSPTYYENLEIIRRVSLNAEVPFSAFTLSIPHWSYPAPTEGHIRFQLYSSLAYGAGELQYFTYGAVPNKDYGDGLIDAKGNKTETYGMASKVNWEIQRMGPVLLELKSTAVFHTDPQPSGTQEFTGHGGLEKCSGEAVLGFFEDSKGQTWLMVVNRDPFDSARVKLTFSDKVESVGELDRTKEGCTVNPVELEKQKLSLPLAAGDGRLFRIDTM
ncbi:MAG: hypothetical protein ABFR33_10680 [Verrucomicrobiota bacterium]